MMLPPDCSKCSDTMCMCGRKWRQYCSVDELKKLSVLLNEIIEEKFNAV